MISSSARGPAESLVERADFLRLDAARQLAPSRRAEFGQFFTAPATARLMASMFQTSSRSIRLLDAGAGVGSLTAAFVAEMCKRASCPDEIEVSAYEIDPQLVPYLHAVLELCEAACTETGIRFRAVLHEEDFIVTAIAALQSPMFAHPERFQCAILNPPYRKINSHSHVRRALGTVGIETTNLYTAFLALVARLLVSDGEMVAITPRSFTNGTYFRPFRRMFLSEMTIRHVHIIDSRSRAFRDDDVLQENIITRAVKDRDPGTSVVISSGTSPEDGFATARQISQGELIRPDDPDTFIHIVPDERGEHVAARMRSFTATLSDLGLGVSTGRVVDFRADDFLRDDPMPGTAPLIYPTHFAQGYVVWPKLPSRKPNALLVAQQTEELLVPSGNYVLVRRFSAKEERRRVVAALFDPDRVPGDRVAFENHLNYFHQDGAGLDLDLAKGLTAFLNSTLVDAYFRQFNGHTQVNATDLRSLRYPTREQLTTFGAAIGDHLLNQEELDRWIEQEMLAMPEGIDPAIVQRR